MTAAAIMASHNGWIATGTDKGACYLWNSCTGELERKFGFHSAGITSMHVRRKYPVIDEDGFMYGLLCLVSYCLANKFRYPKLKRFCLFTIASTSRLPPTMERLKFFKLMTKVVVKYFLFCFQTQTHSAWLGRINKISCLPETTEELCIHGTLRCLVCRPTLSNNPPPSEKKK